MMIAALGRTAAYRRWLSAVVAPVIVGSLSLPLVAAQDPCSLLPGQPEKTVPADQSCTGKYGIRQMPGPEGRGSVEQVGISLTIRMTPNAGTARERVQRVGQGVPGYQTVAYGDVGKEKKEDSKAPDSSEFSDFGQLLGERRSPEYEVAFSCGALFVSGSAQPSKGPDARSLIAELVDRLRAESRCGTTGTSAPAAPVSTPPPTTAVPPSIGERRVFSVAGDCMREGQGLMCSAQASNPPSGVPLEQVRYMWYLDGALQGTRTSTLTLATVSPGAHVVNVKAFTPNTVSTDTFTINVR